MFRYLLGFLLWITSFTLNAQVQLMHFDTEKGLPNNLSEAILRDSYGFLWVGTYNGLSKYDGSNFQNYPVIDSTNGILGSTIFKIFEDSKHQIWIGSNKSISVYDRKQDCFIAIKKEICVTDIDESSDGVIWVSSYSGIFKVDQSKHSILKLYGISKGIPTTILSQCVIDNKGILWVGTQTDGIFTLNPKTEKIKRIIQDLKNQNSLSSNRFKSFAFDKNGKLWIGTTDAGLCLYDTLTKQFQHIRNIRPEEQNNGCNLISNIFVDSKNDVWLSQNGCLNRFDRKTKTFVKYPAERYNDRNFQSNNVCFVTEDSYGIFWFGTYGCGIYCLNKQQNNFNIFFSIPEKSNSLKNNVVNGFVEYEDKIIIGTDGGLQYFNPKTNTFSEFKNKQLSENSVWDIAMFNDDLWCSTYGNGLYHYQLKSNQLSHYLHEENNSQSLSINNIRTTAKIDNFVWIATWGEGLQALDNNYKAVLSNEQVTHYSKVFNKPNWISKILKDSKNRVWIATLYGIFIRQDNRFRVLHNVVNDTRSLHDDMVFSVFEDSKHQIWLATNKGLDKYIEKTNNFEHYGKEKNLPINPTAILEDCNQNLWISAEDGLYSFNESMGIARKYNYRNGLIKGGFNTNSDLKTSDGTMYFGGKNGFISFKPDQFKSSIEVPKIVCRNLCLDNVAQQSIENSDTVYINYSSAIVSISVVDLKDIVSNFASFEYSFDQEKKKWKTIDELKKISFSNKAPGTYFLRIKASYDNKKYSNKVLTIIVIPPWWMTWWFRILSISIIAIILYSYFRIRIRLIQKQNDHLTLLVNEKTQNLVDANDELLQQNTAIAEKEMLLQIRNDELQKTSVTKDKLFSIISQDLKMHFAGIMENAMNLNRLKSLKNEKEKQSYIDSIYGSSKKINTQIDLFLHWSNSQTKTVVCNPQNVNIETLIRENILLNTSIASAKKIDIQFVFEHRFNAFVDEEMITIALRNIVSNALKYTPNQGSIIIQTSNSADYTLIQVRDTGIGMSQNQINDIYTNSVNDSTQGTNNETGTGLGLVISRDFLNLNKAKIEILSQPHEGTTVSMFLPKGNALKEFSNNDKKDKQLEGDNILFSEEESESKLRLLIVEDNSEILDYIVGIFEPYYIIETAVNGEIGFAKALNSIPDLIITDINMPVKTGLEMCLQIQSEPVLHHIPVLILSAFSNFDIQAKGLQAGAFDFVVKPFDRTILFLKVQSVLESRAKFKEYLKKQFIQEPKSVFKETPDDKFMMKMQEVLEKNFADSAFSVEKFSSNMGFSRSQFFRKLKAIIDTTPLEYLNVFRLKKAKEMIEQGSWTISEVAYDVGFNDPHYFSICFKNHFGFPPNHYLKNKS